MCRGDSSWDSSLGEEKATEGIQTPAVLAPKLSWAHKEMPGEQQVPQTAEECSKEPLHCPLFLGTDPLWLCGS